MIFWKVALSLQLLYQFRGYVQVTLWLVNRADLYIVHRDLNVHRKHTTLTQTRHNSLVSYKHQMKQASDEHLFH